MVVQIYAQHNILKRYLLTIRKETIRSETVGFHTANPYFAIRKPSFSRIIVISPCFIRYNRNILCLLRLHLFMYNGKIILRYKCATNCNNREKVNSQNPLFIGLLRVCKVIRSGFEPETHSLEGCCSIQLSYQTDHK